MSASAPPLLVVMGVSGSGKSTVGAQLAAALGVPYLEGDSLHSERNVARMAAGIPLTDDDRQGWLELLSQRLAQARAAKSGLVVACSALKRAYRDLLRRGAPELRLLHLAGTAELLAVRTADRPGHYMPASLLASQFATLELPTADEHAMTFDVALPPADIVRAALAALAARTGDHRDNAISTTPERDMPQFTKVILYTDTTDGRAKFREETLELTEGTPQSRLSPVFPSSGYVLRESPVGFRSQFHCTNSPQWLFVLRGQMEIGLQDGTSRVFKPGDSFYANDFLPAGAEFDAKVHGHWSRQVGPDPLVTLFVR